jgi:monoamine oxidase
MPAGAGCLRVTRRQWLRRLGLATGVALTTSLMDDLHALLPPDRPLHVVILGAGLAGLCAAYELEQRGHTCVLLEADPRHIGGRARTLRFEDGLYGEAGAMRIPLGHALTRHYVKAFGLPLRPFVQANPEAYYYMRGQRAHIKDVHRFRRLYALQEAEREKTPDDLWADVVVRQLQALTDQERADLSSVTPQTAAIRALDQQSLQQLCEAAGLSPDAIEWLAVSYGLEALLSSAATEHLREERDQVWAQEFHEIIGGTDRLPAAFAARLRSRPRLGCEVIQVEQDPLRRRAAAIYRRHGPGNPLQRAEGDFVLCTLPVPVLGRLPFAPPLSGAKQRAIRELHYDSATKVLAVTNRRFWETDDHIFGGGTYTDLPTGVTYYPADNATAKDPRVSAAAGVLLASYTWGHAARRLAALPHTARARLVMRHLSAVHPQLIQKGILRRTASWNWDTYRWSGGAFAWFLPGQHTALHQHLVAPEGRLFFAGEHVSLTHTWMQGALESALQAVRDMLASSRQ